MRGFKRCKEIVNYWVFDWN